MKSVLPILLAAAAAVPLASAQTPRADWFQKAKWGVFMHYLGSEGVSPEEWNRRIDGFDVEGLARQLERAGAGYFFITLGQNSGHFLSPNAAYDELTGIRPSKLSRRDLVLDLYKALAPRGIRLMVYLPAGAPDRDPAAMAALEWAKGPQRNAAFQRKWERIISEWSRRWGTKVSGWWFDGCYWPNAMYRSATAPNYASFAAAARAGNPGSIVAFNRGVVVPIHSETPEEDYTAGEIDDPAKASFGEFWRDGAQPQMLSYLGTQWSGGPPRFSPEEAAKITRRLVDQGGVVTWDVPHNAAGLIADEFMERLVAVGQAAGNKK
jgi:alpha-L-fucosidase